MNKDFSPRAAAPAGAVIRIPGRTKPLEIRHVVFDFNGTLAADGRLVPGVRRRLSRLAKACRVLVLTSDTFGTARTALKDLPLEVHVVPNGAAKRRFVERLGRETVATVGNGANDVPMMRAAAFRLAVLGAEGMSAELVGGADVIARDINEALDILCSSQRIIATLRR